MSLISRLDNDLKQALLSKDKEVASLLRLIKAALKNEMINLRKDELSDDETIKILRKEAKKRQDSIEQFTKGNRIDLAEQEKKELTLIEKYLPAQMSLTDIKKIVTEVISSMDQVGPSQFGQVIGLVMKKTAGQADGSLVSQAVKEAIK